MKGPQPAQGPTFAGGHKSNRMSDLGLDELEAIGAIYSDDAAVHSDERSVVIQLPNANAVPRIQATIHLPLDYPFTSPPIVSSLIATPDRVDSSLLAWCSSFIEILFTPGKEVLLDYISWLGQQREIFGEEDPSEQHKGEEQEEEEQEVEEVEEVERPIPALPSKTIDDGDEILIQRIASRIITGQPIVEKRSTFLAHCCRVKDVSEVRAVIQALLRISKIKGATHPCIMAYRINKTTSDCDDDGESGAGGRLLHLLHMTDTSQVVVVVTRWFGGVLLGPSRFGIINNAARRLLEDEGFIKPGGKGKKG